MEFTEMVFRLWLCCIVTSACVSAATVLGLSLLVSETRAKKKARLVQEDEPGDVRNTSSNLHNQYSRRF